MRTIYGLGETVYDIIFRDNQPQRAVPGGSTFNSLISLGRCGLHPVMVTETGDDHVGSIITSFMDDNGVSAEYVTINEGTKTHISLAFLNEANDARYQFYKDHASANPCRRFPDFQAGDIVLFGSFFAINPAIRDYTREFLERAHSAGCLLYYDINFRAAHIADLPQVIGNIEENIRLADIVRASDEDLGCIYGSSASNDIAATYHQRIAPLCSFYICTKGARGVEVYTSSDAPYCYPTPAISTVSTIGAGDNFNAGFIHSLFSANISSDDITHLPHELVTAAVNSGQLFAVEVCTSLDNYISYAFAATRQRLPHCKAYLFDLDGVIIDTEGLYQKFWGEIGRRFYPEIPDFATRIKGSTLTAIHDTYFSADPVVRDEVDRLLIEYEDNMVYSLFPGALQFVRRARQQGILCAVVTSSNHKKMDSLAKQLPALATMFDKVFTAEDAGRGKPFPDCYIKAASYFGLETSECIVFEDSINGLRAAKDSGAFVVGLTTTHGLEVVEKLSDLVVAGLHEL